MKLLMLVHGYDPAIGGVEHLAQLVAEGLARRAHEMIVFTTDAYNTRRFVEPLEPRIPGRHEVINGVTVRRFPVMSRVSRILRVPQAASYRLRLPGNDFLRTVYRGPIAPGMVAALWRARPDVITAASFPLLHMHFPFLIPSVRRPPIVLIGAIHTNDDWGYGGRNLLRLVRRADRYVALTQFEKRWLVDRNVEPQRISVIGPGINVTRFTTINRGAFRSKNGITHDAPLIAFVGQHGAHKGIETLIRAMPRVWSKHPTARLVIAGARTYYTASLHQLAELTSGPHPGRILFVDQPDQELKAAVLGDATMFASPSGYESFGITFLEAWAAGLAVIGARTEAVESVVADGQDGLLVKYGDAGALAGAICRLVDNPILRERFARAGKRKLLEHYTIEKVVDKYDTLYRSLGPVRR